MKKRISPSSRAPTHARTLGCWLLIDNSNTRTKVALLRANCILKIHYLPTKLLMASSLDAMMARKNIERAIVSSVVPKTAQILKKIFKTAKIPSLFINGSMDLGIKFRYPNPSSLGADRLANIVGATALYKTPIIVVDFGTAITLDIVDTKGIYLGGIIAPGLTTAAEALHQRAALVPLVKPTSIRRATGKNTLTALQSGLLLSARGLVRESINRISKENFSGQRPTVIATGGDAKLVAQNTDLFDIINPKLTLEGLREIGKRVS